MFTKAWLTNTLHLVGVAFAGTFVGAMVTSGANWLSLTSVHAAVVAAGTAAFMALQSALAAVISPPASATPFVVHAVWQRIVYAVQKGTPPPPTITAADLEAAIGRLTEAVQALPRAVTPPAPPPPAG
jgi:hypothetical protein